MFHVTNAIALNGVHNSQEAFCIGHRNNRAASYGEEGWREWDIEQVRMYFTFCCEARTVSYVSISGTKFRDAQAGIASW